MIELDPSVRYVLPLLLPESSLAFLLVLKENRALASLSEVLVASNLNRILIGVVILEESDNVLRLASKWQASQPQSSVVSHLKVLVLRIYDGDLPA